MLSRLKHRGIFAVRYTSVPEMGELRYDSLNGEWVAVAGSRHARPNLPQENCPFCVGGLEAPEPYEVRAFSNRWPTFTPGVHVELAGAGVPARGACEVILYSPRHDASLASLGVERVRRVVDLWAERTEALLERPEVEYVLVFENRGADAGATIPHPHGQIYGFPFVPPVPAREALMATQDGCALCMAPIEQLLVHRECGWRAWVPFASAYPYGLLIAPEDHVPTLMDLSDAGRDAFAAALVNALGRLDRLFGKPFPYMLWIHPGVHVHVHVAPPRRSADTLRHVASAEVGSGTLMNPVMPEHVAEALRRA